MKTYTFEPTKNRDLYRIVDRKGNWENYLLAPRDLVAAELEKQFKRKQEFFDALKRTHEFPEILLEKGKILRGCTNILSTGYIKGAFYDEWLLKMTKDERDEILKNTGEKGDKVHKYIDSVLDHAGTKGFGNIFSRDLTVMSREKQDHETLADDEWYAVLSWWRFWIAHKPILFSSEQPFYNLKEGYAGTLDALLILTQSCGVSTCPCSGVIGKLGIWDWKTGSGIRASYSAQLGAGANGENIPMLASPFKAVEYGAILRIGTQHKRTNGSEMAIYPRLTKKMKGESDEEYSKRKKGSLDHGFERFLFAKGLSDFEYRRFNPALDIQEIPEEFEINVPRWNSSEDRKKFKEFAVVIDPNEIGAAVVDAVEKKKKDSGKSKGNGPKARSVSKAPARKAGAKKAPKRKAGV